MKIAKVIRENIPARIGNKRISLSCMRMCIVCFVIPQDLESLSKSEFCMFSMKGRG